MSALYDVWYASVGCLPDGDDGPDFTGTYEDCEAWIASQVDEGVPALGWPSDHDGNLYRFTIEAHEYTYDDLCNTCGGTGRWESTTEDQPTTLVDLGPCPECNPTHTEA